MRCFRTDIQANQRFPQAMVIENSPTTASRWLEVSISITLYLKIIEILAAIWLRPWKYEHRYSNII